MLRSKESCYGEGLHLVGVNHCTLSVAGRERLARPRDERRALLLRLHSRGIAEAAVLSTCNRFEVIAAGKGAPSRIREELAACLGSDFDRRCLYEYRNSSAALHLFRVAASLDSLVLGEAQILGQVKEAYRDAVECGTAGRYLHRVFQCAFAVAKKVRSQTAIGGHSTSVSYIAVQLARQIFGSLTGKHALIVGSGATAELAALQIRRSGCRNITVANRSVAHAEDLAQRVGAAAVGLSELEACLGAADLVISAVCCDRPLVDAAAVKRLKRSSPLFLIDLGVPRNFPPALADLDNIYLYNLDDLAAVAEQHRELRQEAAQDAELMVEYALLQFERRLLRFNDQAQLLGLRARVRQICMRELMAELRGLAAVSDLEAASARLGHRISQKISHELLENMLAEGRGRFDPRSLLPLFLDELLEEADETLPH